MEELLKLLSLKDKLVVTYFEEKYYDITIVQDSWGNAIYIEVLKI